MKVQGHSLTEYGLVAALVCVVSMVGIRLLGQTLNLSFGNMIPGPSSVTNIAGSQQGDGSPFSSDLKGNVGSFSGEVGLDGTSASSNAHGQSANAPGTVQTAGGLGNQDEHNSSKEPPSEQGQNGTASQKAFPDDEQNLISHAERSESEAESIGSEKQLQIYSDQLAQYAEKFKDQYPDLYSDLIMLSESGKSAGAQLTEFQNAAVIDSSLGMGMAGGRRAYSQTWRMIGMSSDYGNLSPQDKQTISQLANASLDVIDKGMIRPR